MPERNQSEERLSAALRELAVASRQGVSPELGLMLKDSFRHHHARRRRLFRIRAAALAVFAVGLGLAFLVSVRSPKDRVDRPAVVHTIAPEEVPASKEVSVLGTKRPVAPKKISPPNNASAATNVFVALPSFAMVPAGDELRVVRLEVSGEDLRLVGAPVNEELASRRVTADFVVGRDGTPYAMRLVNFKENHP